MQLRIVAIHMHITQKRIDTTLCALITCFCSVVIAVLVKFIRQYQIKGCSAPLVLLRIRACYRARRDARKAKARLHGGAVADDIILGKQLLYLENFRHLQFVLVQLQNAVPVDRQRTGTYGASAKKRQPPYNLCVSGYLFF